MIWAIAVVAILPTSFFTSKSAIMLPGTHLVMYQVKMSKKGKCLWGFNVWFNVKKVNFRCCLRKRTFGIKKDAPV